MRSMLGTEQAIKFGDGVWGPASYSHMSAVVRPESYIAILDPQGHYYVGGDPIKAKYYSDGSYRVYGEPGSELIGHRCEITYLFEATGIAAKFKPLFEEGGRNLKGDAQDFIRNRRAIVFRSTVVFPDGTGFIRCLTSLIFFKKFRWPSILPPAVIRVIEGIVQKATDGRQCGKLDLGQSVSDRAINMTTQIPDWYRK